MKTAKKIMTLLLVMLLAFSFTACGKEEAEEAPVTGGWTENAVDTAPTDEETAVFEKAVDGTEYSDYELVATLGTQVVAGMNYKFLCSAPDGAQKLVVVFQDLEDSCSINVVEDY